MNKKDNDFKVESTGNVNSTNAVSFDLGLLNQGVDFGDKMLGSMDEDEFSSAELAQFAKHISDVKLDDVSEQYKIITLLSLYTGSEEDFAELQRELKVQDDYIIDRPTFYKQLLDYANGNEETTMYHPFVTYVVNQTNKLSKSTKKLKAPTVAEYVLKMQQERAKVDPNLDNRDQRFTRKEAMQRGFIIPKHMLPVEGKGREALYDTMTAVPKSYFKSGVLQPIYKIRWDSPLLRSRKTKYPLFSRDGEDFPNFDKYLKELGNLYGYDIVINEYKCFEKDCEFSPRYFTDNHDVIYNVTTNKQGLVESDPRRLVVRRYRRHFSNSTKDLIPTPEPEYPNSDINRVKINDYELFAETQKALLIAPYFKKMTSRKEFRQRIKNIASIINANGGRHAKTNAKRYYSYMIDVAAMMATRNAMFAYDFDKDKDYTKYGQYSKKVSLSLDQGLEFQFGNKLAAFYEPKARWLIPVVQEIANEMTYDFYKRKGVTPEQIAEGMRRVNLTPGLVRDIPADKATNDDYAMVLYNSIERVGKFDLTSVKKVAQEQASGIANTTSDIQSENDKRFSMLEQMAEAQRLGISYAEYKARKAKEEELTKQKTQEINEISEKRQEIVNEVVGTCEEPEIIKDVTFADVVTNIDEKDDIDRVIEGEATIVDVTQDYVNKSETESKVYTETVAASMENDPICYIDSKGRASFSQTELESLNKVDMSSEVTTKEETIISSESTTETNKERVVKKNTGLPTNIVQKIRTTMFKRFNSNIQKMKLDVENKLDKKLKSVEGKKITKASQDRIDDLYAQLSFYEDLIIDNIESIPELSKINKFKSKKVMSNTQLNVKAKSSDINTSRIGAIQKEMLNIINETIVGVTEMIEKNPEECTGKSITQLLSAYKKKELIDDKMYIKQVISEVMAKQATQEQAQTVVKVNQKVREKVNDR